MSLLPRRDSVASHHLQDFVRVSRRILRTSALFREEGAVVEVLINPAAGMLQEGIKFRRMMSYLGRMAGVQERSAAPRDNLVIRFHETESRDHAGERAVRVVRELADAEEPGRKVLVLAGGDGFHNDIGNALMSADPGLFTDIVLFRLPMGTGNDTADSPTVDEAFGLLASAGRVKEDAVIEVQTAVGDRHFAFNVCSFGLDAYVCELSNRMKKWGPRSVYKVFADLAVFRYEKVYPLRPWDITIHGPDGRIVREGRYLLTVFGRKGGTRYGGGMKVLPGEENFLLVDPVGLMTKLRIKPLFYRGAHRGLPIAELFRADELTLDHMGDILMELDGEVVPLKREDFPMKVRRLPGALNVLS